MYDYQRQRPHVFTENGQKLFLEIRDRTHKLIAEAGAASMQRIISKSCGDSWNMIACVDRLVELEEIYEIPNLRYGARAVQNFLFTP